MLSFAAAPSFFFEDNLLTPQRTRRVATPSRRNNIYCSHPCSHSADPFDCVFRMRDAYVAPPRVEVFSRALQTGNSYQIQVMKKNDPSNSFDDYQIQYRFTNAGNTLISIGSRSDSFDKTFSFKTATIDLDDAEWRIIDNVLLVNIPKKKLQTVVQVRTISPKNCNVSKTQNKKRSEHHKKKVISVPITRGLYTTETSDVFERAKSVLQDEPVPERTQAAPSKTVSQTDLEDEEPVTSEAESASETESTVSDTESEVTKSEPVLKQLPKLKRKVSLEEVEDESFQ
ncbi:uncharacterized protein CYBJADRAFT_165675 [Cyberlindnera jadinii NRRL Y-1542]|uniref:Uncharacterized protein n=1 Tax=Cyberlindnera jadinii (strain ATCC 18201 / CBS 1600 / BCRC 20928 / JCM 3617 / NBRC 0987 / NRRL Y-1542) TaxID=983966 RepID=A0A1E4SA51_CYBJN|nr:hypothetical protein CYBJADRAFT_165675 [Cyberlindnera jadinii NRRL Y-1542]ODV76383.1 hypothetical protein CYBJADRAFT_165675 [Cyberlindnera jadinii NRRL Y-1542]